MDFYTFLDLAKAYNDLGWSVQEQLDEYVASEGDSAGKLNPNAVKMIEKFLGDLEAAGVEVPESEELDDEEEEEEEEEEIAGIESIVKEFRTSQ